MNTDPNPNPNSNPNPNPNPNQVQGMEALCISGEPLVLVASTSVESPRKRAAKHNAAVYARNLDAVGN